MAEKVLLTDELISEREESRYWRRKYWIISRTGLAHRDLVLQKIDSADTGPGF